MATNHFGESKILVQMMCLFVKNNQTIFKALHAVHFLDSLFLFANKMQRRAETCQGSDLTIYLYSNSAFCR